DRPVFAAIRRPLCHGRRIPPGDGERGLVLRPARRGGGVSKRRIPIQRSSQEAEVRSWVAWLRRRAAIGAAVRRLVEGGLLERVVHEIVELAGEVRFSLAEHLVPDIARARLQLVARDRKSVV